MSDTTTSSLISKCRTGTTGEQNDALIRLVQANAYDAVPVIVTLLGSPDAGVRANAAYAVGQLGAGQVDIAGPALLALLQDPDTTVRSDAVEALGWLRYEPATGPISAMLQTDSDPLIRAEAAETLGDMGAKEALAVLETTLQRDTDDDVRAYAANAIGLLGNVTSLPLLVQQFTRESSLRVKAELLGARYRLGERDALSQFLALLQTAEEDLATAILNILDDLTTREPPSTLGADAAQVGRVLMAAGGRIPILQPHVDQILQRLQQPK